MCSSIAISLFLEVFKKCILRDMAWWAVLVVGGWLDYIILEIFSNLNDTLIIVPCGAKNCWTSEPYCCMNSAEYMQVNVGLGFLILLTCLTLSHLQVTYNSKAMGHVSNIKPWGSLWWKICVAAGAPWFEAKVYWIHKFSFCACNGFSCLFSSSFWLFDWEQYSGYYALMTQCSGRHCTSGCMKKQHNSQKQTSRPG